MIHQDDGRHAEGPHESSPSLLEANLASPKMKKGKTTKHKKSHHASAIPMTKSKTKGHSAGKKGDLLSMAQTT